MIILLLILLGAFGIFEVFVGFRLIAWGLWKLTMTLLGRWP